MTASKNKPASSYSASHIEVLEGLDPVRRRPGMYTDTSSPLHLLQELIDNSVDEALAGHASEITIEIQADDTLVVTDNGRGMPIDEHPIHKKPAVELILGSLHSGAKFKQGAYGFSGGLHGVGVSVVNALSESLIVEIFRQGKIYQICYSNGDIVTPLTVLAQKRPPYPHGTRVKATINKKYFESAVIPREKLERLLKTKALLCPNLNIVLKTPDREKRWCFPQGLKSYLSSLSFDSPLWKNPWHLDWSDNTIHIESVVLWAEEGIIQDSFVNLIQTVQGGSHIQSLKTGLLEALRDYARTHGKHLREKITPEDLYTGLNFIFSLKMANPNFIGQTKEKLASVEVVQPITHLIKNAFHSWLLTHQDEAAALITVIHNRQEHRLLLAEKKQLKKASSIKLPPKLADCSSKVFDERELYLVEGDSAGSSAKQARDKRFQAILPLRGKILNTWDMKSHKIYESEEVKNIITTIGVEPLSSDLSSLRYNRICLLSDADSDGSHIVTLLCALFVQHFPAIVTAGHLYVARPPLYRIDIGKQHFYIRTEQEKEALLQQYKNKSFSIMRFKGLGEMNPSQLRSTTLCPENRTLLRMELDLNAHAELDRLMSKNRAADRKTWLEQEPGINDYD
jgi:topoisomerase-4 subunit B